MNALGYLILFLAALTVVVALSRNFVHGTCVAVAFLIATPAALRIPTGLFFLTPQRLIIVLLLLFWLSARRGLPIPPARPHLRLLLLFGLSQAFSVMLSVTPVESIKNFLDFGIETVVFYIIISGTITAVEDALLLLRYACLGAGVAAFIGFLQHYTGFDIYTLTGTVANASLRNYDETMAGTSTFPHRILFGYAMAMAAPLLVALLALAKGLGSRLRTFALLGLVSGACFFATSRGPWLAAGLACGGLWLFCTAKVRKILLTAGVLAGVLLVVKPGVWETIDTLYSQTREEGTVKAKSYHYRGKLWEVAFSEISMSPARILFGYGGMSREGMDLSRYFEAQQGSNIAMLGYTSWDNNLAADLLEYGALGFLAETILFAGVLAKLWSARRGSAPAYRDMTTCLLASCGIFIFAYATVYIYSPQLKCLFWALAAVGSASVWAPAEDAALEEGGTREDGSTNVDRPPEVEAAGPAMPA